jgi:hypothetical protein
MKLTKLHFLQAQLLSFIVFAISFLPSTVNASQAKGLFNYVPTSASACSEVDFRKTFPLIIRNQKSVSWCFAHSTADLLQYLEQTPIQISAADIAINYSKSDWSRFLHFFKRMLNASDRARPAETGLAKFAAQMIIPQGYCPESVFPSEDWQRINADGTQVSEEIIDATSTIFELQKSVQNGEIATANDLPYYYSFKHIDRDTFFELLLNTQKLKVLEAFRNAACNGERIAFTHHADIYMNLRSSSIFQNINASFDASMPMTIDFFATILKDIDAPTDVTKHFHTVLLYGRHYDSIRGECRYLLKDSYGPDCSRYDPKLQCELGYLWIPESTLFRTMTSTVIYQSRD